MMASLVLQLFGLASPIFTQVIVDDAILHKDVPLLNAMLGEALAAGNVDAAAPLARRLAALRPDDPEIARLAAKLSGQ